MASGAKREGVSDAKASDAKRSDAKGPDAKDSGGKGPNEKNVDETLTWLDPAKLSFRWAGGPGPIRLTLEGDRSVLDVHASRAFPLTFPDQLVQLFTRGKDGTIGMLEECLRRDRILPEVKRILSAEERQHIVLWVVETDRGVTSFDMDKVYENVRRQPAGDVVLTDVVRNRYHVYPEDLDPASREILERYS